MKTFLLAIAFTCSGLTSFGQSATVPPQSDNTEYSEQFLKWIAYLYEQGITIQGDSIIVSAEIQNVINNKALSELLYPEEYTWTTAVDFLQQMDIKRALWFFINLYPENKELVMKSIIKYDQLFEMDHALLGAFYTYAMVDPQVASIVDGKPVIQRPDLLESKLQTVREMVDYVLYFRSYVGKE